MTISNEYRGLHGRVVIITGGGKGTAFPVMLSAGLAHFLALELLFKPVLVELGAI
jgi:hypothetical protein